MEKQLTDHDISVASETLSLASNKHEDYYNDTYTLFQPTILSAIATLRLKGTDVNSIYEQFTKIEASNAEKEFIEGVILQII